VADLEYPEFLPCTDASPDFNSLKKSNRLREEKICPNLSLVQIKGVEMVKFTCLLVLTFFGATVLFAEDRDSL